MHNYTTGQKHLDSSTPGRIGPNSYHRTQRKPRRNPATIATRRENGRRRAHQRKTGKTTPPKIPRKTSNGRPPAMPTAKPRASDARLLHGGALPPRRLADGYVISALGFFAPPSFRLVSTCRPLVFSPLSFGVFHALSMLQSRPLSSLWNLYSDMG